MINKKLHPTSLLLLVFGFILISCEKESNHDPRDIFAGKYAGIEIYTDMQQGICDTANAVVYLNKVDTDTSSILELDLPNSNNVYYYQIVNGQLDNYGFFYHCPVLTYKNDSLFIEWQASLAPKIYKFIGVKNSH